MLVLIILGVVSGYQYGEVGIHETGKYVGHKDCDVAVTEEVIGFYCKSGAGSLLYKWEEFEVGNYDSEHYKDLTDKLVTSKFETAEEYIILGRVGSNTE